MYLLFESASGDILDASIFDVDCVGSAKTEKEAMAWRNENINYRAYKYVKLDN